MSFVRISPGDNKALSQARRIKSQVSKVADDVLKLDQKDKVDLSPEPGRVAVDGHKGKGQRLLDGLQGKPKNENTLTGFASGEVGAPRGLSVSKKTAEGHETYKFAHHRDGNKEYLVEDKDGSTVKVLETPGGSLFMDEVQRDKSDPMATIHGSEPWQLGQYKDVDTRDVGQITLYGNESWQVQDKVGSAPVPKPERESVTRTTASEPKPTELKPSPSPPRGPGQITLYGNEPWQVGQQEEPKPRDPGKITMYGNVKVPPELLNLGK